MNDWLHNISGFISGSLKGSIVETTVDSVPVGHTMIIVVIHCVT